MNGRERKERVCPMSVKEKKSEPCRGRCEYHPLSLSLHLHKLFKRLVHTFSHATINLPSPSWALISSRSPTANKPLDPSQVPLLLTLDNFLHETPSPVSLNVPLSSFLLLIRNHPDFGNRTKEQKKELQWCLPWVLSGAVQRVGSTWGSSEFQGTFTFARLPIYYWVFYNSLRVEANS